MKIGQVIIDIQEIALYLRQIKSFSASAIFNCFTKVLICSKGILIFIKSILSCLQTIMTCPKGICVCTQSIWAGPKNTGVSL